MKKLIILMVVTMLAALSTAAVMLLTSGQLAAQEPTTYGIHDGADGGDCGLIGNWVTVGDVENPDSQTCILTGDVRIGDNIQVCNFGSAGQVVLDGNGFSITGLGTGVGVVIEECGDVTVKNLTVQNFESGIVVDIGSAFISILDNIISDGQFGINILNSPHVVSDHLVTGNTISNNAVGINLDESSHDNQIYNNNFVDNVIQAQDEGTNNLFNLSAPTGGNYWSNYDSPAEGCDNLIPADEFCDVPYAFTLNQDNLPWVVSNGWLDGDGDGDGVLNAFDQCEFTPLDTIVDPTNGCSIDQLNPCEGPRGTTVPWKNHGKYVSSVAKSANSFLEQGLITEEEKDAIMSSAANSACGKK
jgi:parallel beta-helix repeat protein